MYGEWVWEVGLVAAGVLVGPAFARLGRQTYQEETFIAKRPGRRWLVLKTLLSPRSVVPAEGDQNSVGYIAADRGIYTTTSSISA
jgi:hypothetical protein